VSLSPGQRFGPYEIVAPLGAGGMGEVYRARDTKLDREVAIKLLPPAFASDADRLARFQREARLLAALNHPNVAAIHGLDEADGQPFLVLELAEGEDLSERIARGRVPVDEALAIARQVAEALEAAHEKGIVHRDLKPANVKVGADGQVKVLDFGLAKAWSGDAVGAASGSGALSQSPTLAHTGTEAGLLLGTAAYMAPEQARGKPVDKRADVWAFGAVVFEMLAGHKLFEGETITDVLAAVVRQEIDWSALPAATPPGILRLLRRCLERDPKQRLRDIGEARIALSAPDDTATPAPLPPRGLSRRTAAALVAGAAGGAFALGVGVGRRFPGGGGPAAGEGQGGLSITRVTSSGNVTGAVLSPDGRFVAYVESDQGEQSLWLRQLATGQTLRLAPPRNVYYWGLSFTRDGNAIVFGLKSPEDIDGAFHSISTLGGAARRLVAGIDCGPAFSPDGSRMAWVRARHPTPEESALMIAKADGSESRVLSAFALPEAVAPIFWAGPDWSPDGRRIAVAVVRLGSEKAETAGKIVAVSVEDGRKQTLAEPGWRFVAQVAWLPGGEGLLAIARSDEQEHEQVWLVPRPGDAPRPVTSDLLQYRIVSLAADGRSFLTVAADSLSSVWLAPREGGGRSRKLGGSKVDGAFGLDFAPDGRIVYTSVEGGKLGLWITGADAAERSPLVTGDESAVNPVIAASGGVFYVARTRAGKQIRRAGLDGSPSRLVARGVLDPDFAVSPDGQDVVYTALGNGEGRLFRVSTSGGAPEPLTDYSASTPAFSPDGKRLAFYYLDGRSRRLRIGIAPAAGGRPELSLDAEAPNNLSKIVFAEGGLYLNSISGDRANLWLQPLDGRPPRRVTDFQDQLLADFAFSSDGKSLAYSRVTRTRDALLVRGFR
jgi:Tol biopolymer transport system component/tRNA A-37 threonylcarbamoyl transferase component Bud32